MNVLYDISVLGFGYNIPKARTGVFRVIENVAGQLVLNRDCNVTFCSNTDRQTLAHSLSYLDNTQQLSNVSFSKPPFFDTRFNIAAKKDDLIKQIVTGTALSPVKKLQVKWKIKELLAIERMYQMYNDDLIHPRDVKNADIYHSPFYPVPASVKNGNFKSLFLTCYDLIPMLFPQYFEQSIIDLMKNILKSITPETWVLCISHATRNDLLNFMGKGINPDRVIVTELAASDNFYPSMDEERNLALRKKLDIPDGPYILSLCTFEPRKNIDQVIKAFAKIIAQENISDLQLVLVGSKGWMFEKIFEEISSNTALKDRIIITGFVADEDLASLYSNALFFVYPSFYEGFGLPPLEAMKCGTPVITSNSSSLPEVVGDAGIMVAPTDLDALCQAMISVYKSPGLQRQLAAKSLERAGQFSWERCGTKTVNAYAASMI